MDVAAKNVVTFQPGKEMEEQVKQFAKLAEPKKKPRKKSAKASEPRVEPVTAVPSTNGTGAPADGAPSVPASSTTAATPAPEPVTSDAPAAP